MTVREYNDLGTLHHARVAQGWIVVEIPDSLLDKTEYAHCINWLNEHVGPVVGNYDMTDSQTNGEWDHLMPSKIIIKDTQKAMMFKLVWGGRE